MIEKIFLKFRQFLKTRKFHIAVLAVIIMSMLLFALWNAERIYDKLNDNTVEYCQESALQMCHFVNFGLNSKKIELASVAHSLEKVYEYDEDTVTEFLDRKIYALDFDTLFLLDSRNTCRAFALRDGMEVDFSQIAEELQDESLFDEQLHMGFLEGESLYYAVPVHMPGLPVHMLIGIRNQDTMQAAITSNAFQNSTLSCIVDKTGKVLLSPSDLTPFTEMGNIIQNDQNELSAEIRIMEKNMLAEKSGTIQFTGLHDQRLILVYHPLKFNHWFLLTIVPADLLTKNILFYQFESIICALVAALMFIVLMRILYSVNNESRKKLVSLAYSDRITGGMNINAFQRKYRQAVKETQPLGSAIVFINIRNFKQVNANMGFETGDAILKEIYQVIEANLNLNRGEFVARSLVDHFFICMDADSEEEVTTRLRGLKDAVYISLSKFIPCGRLEFTIGCYLIEDKTMDIREVQDRARLAEQDERTTSTLCVFYDKAFGNHIKWDSEINDRFDSAIQNREFEAYFQPKVNLTSGKPVGAEALVRWNHPDIGIIPPGKFVPQFEYNGKICRLDLYMFEEICRFYKKRKAEGNPWYPVSVNLSRYHFFQQDFLDQFRAISRSYGLPPGAIEFELTESLIFDLSDMDLVKQSIATIHEMGFGCSLDDFGSGYSSLGILRELDIDVIKLDRLFFLNMDSEKAQEIIRMVVEMAAKLKIGVVAEGIEEASQIEFLRSIHCDTVQGYFFSKPLPVDEFTRWVKPYETDENPSTI